MCKLNSQTSTKTTHQQCREINQTIHKQENQDLHIRNNLMKGKITEPISLGKFNQYFTILLTYGLKLSFNRGDTWNI
jgi:hypothetical protein